MCSRMVGKTERFGLASTTTSVSPFAVSFRLGMGE